ncbi:hypothetical protein GCM10008944_01530 [Cytobacillus oceanisediminis]
MAAKSTWKHTCRGCRLQFTSGSPKSVWCSKTCRNRVKRDEVRADEQAKAKATATATAPDHPLVERIRLELKAKNASDSVDGLLAVHLALAIAAAEKSGKTGPVAAFRDSRARALGLTEKPLPAEGDGGEVLPVEGEAELAQILQMRDATSASIAAG